MKKLAVLVVVPWVIVGLDSDPKNYCVRTPDTVFWCGTNKSDIEDLAAALNEAHERRKEPDYWSDKDVHVSTGAVYIREGEFIWTHPHGDEPPNGRIWTTHEKHIVLPNTPGNPVPFDYKSACGQDDCGSEPDSK